MDNSNISTNNKQSYKINNSNNIILDDQEIDLSKIEQKIDQSGFNLKEDLSPLCKKLSNLNTTNANNNISNNINIRK